MRGKSWALSMQRVVMAVLALLTFLGVQVAQGDADTAGGLSPAKAADLVKGAGVPCSITEARRVPPRAMGEGSSAPHYNAVDSATSGASAGGGHASLYGMSGGNGTAMQSFNLEVDYGPSAAGPSGDTTRYELACAEGLGYIVTIPAKQKPSAYLCIEAPVQDPATAPDDAKSKSTQCVLELNSASLQLAAVARYVAQTRAQCEPVRARGIGHNAHVTVFEVACSNGEGYVLQTSYPLKLGQPVTAANCMGIGAAEAISCRFTDAAAKFTVAENLLHAAKPECAIQAHRYVGMLTSGGKYLEFRCADGSGYLLKQGADAQLAGLLSCSDPAAANLGGCKLAAAATSTHP